MELRTLFEPITIGRSTVRNRIVMPPMVTNSAEAGGAVSEPMLAYYRKRAVGVGLVIVESSNVLRGGEIVSHQLQICDDTFIPGLERLSGVIKSGGARALVQLNHGGAKAFPVPGAGVPLSASTVPITHGVIPRSMTTGEIGAMVSYFAEAARRSVEAGFDGVEIQGCHFYLLSQFLSPYSNTRTDEYGGDTAGRARFLREVVEAIRDRVGPDVIICCRINGIETLENGLSVRETSRIAGIFEKAGADAIHVSGVIRSVKVTHEGETFTRLVAALMKDDAPGAFADAAAHIKAGVDIPVILAGKILSPSLGETFLREGNADMIAFGRAMLVNEEFGRMLSEGRLDELVACTECYTCLEHILNKKPVGCSVNPELFGTAEPD